MARRPARRAPSPARTASAADATGPGMPVSASTAVSRTRPSRAIDAATTHGRNTAARRGAHSAAALSRSCPALKRRADSSSRSHLRGSSGVGGAARAALGRLPLTAGVSRRPGRRPDRLEVRLAGQGHVERLEKPGRAQQKPRRVAVPALVRRDLPAQALRLRGLQRDQRPGLSRDQPPQPVCQLVGVPLTRAAVSSRSARRPGPGVSSAARSRNAAARPALRGLAPVPRTASSSAATSSSGPAAAWRPVPGPPAGSAAWSVASARARCMSCLRCTDTDR